MQNKLFKIVLKQQRGVAIITALLVVILAATIALQLFSGLMIVLGWHGRLGALALGLFCFMTAFLFHNNFQNHNELLHFEKDLAIAGGMFAITILGTGRLSLDQYL